MLSLKGHTVEPPLSGPPLSGTSIIRHLNSLKKKMGVSAAVTVDQECSSSADEHAQTPTFTAVYQLSGWIKAWFIPIRLSGMAQEQRCN